LRSLILRPPPLSTLFPYTTLFRSTIPLNATLSALQERIEELETPEANQPMEHEGDENLVSSEADVAVSLITGSDGNQLVFIGVRSEEHTSELQSRENLVCRLLLEK